jgi:hypothetical protein
VRSVKVQHEGVVRSVAKEPDQSQKQQDQNSDKWSDAKVSMEIGFQHVDSTVSLQLSEERASDKETAEQKKSVDTNVRDVDEY